LLKLARHSEQSTGHGMHCRYILFTPRCSSRAKEFPRCGRIFGTTYSCRATRRQSCLFFGFWHIFLIQKPLKSTFRWPAYSPGVTLQNDFDFSVW